MYTLLIADDEEIECYGIIKVIAECFPQITVVGSAYNSMELIQLARKHHPDMIIADINMPGMNGLEAVEILRREKIYSKVIINTAYSYFEYAKKAILIKAVDYLLKPIEREAFCRTIEKVLYSIEQERKKDFQNIKDKQSFQKMLDVAGKEVLSSVIMGRPNVEELNTWLENMGHTYWGGFFVVGKCTRDELLHEEVIQKIYGLAKKKQKTGASLAKIFNGMLIWFFFPEEEIGKNNYREWIGKYLEEFKKEVKEITACEMYFGISDWRYDFEDMHQAYLEAVNLVHNLGEPKIINLEKEQNRDQVGCFDKIVKELTGYVKKQDMEKCELLLERQLKYWNDTDMTQVEQNVMLTLLLQRCSRKICGHNIYSWNQVKVLTFQHAQSLSRAVTYLLYNLDTLKDAGNTRMAYISKSLLYIEQHFTENISLDMAADSMEISSFYLSRLLTQQLQTSFIELLTSERINRAIELICDSKKIVKNIGLKCGYQSAAYFYKAFKKNTGMTVGEMREFLSKQ